MSAPLYIKVKDADNVAIAVHDIPRGTGVMPGVVTREDIPQAHKIALTDIPKGGEVVRYGVVLGCAKAPIPVGAWINEHMLDLPQSPGLDDMPYGTSVVPMEELPDPPRRTWMGYRPRRHPQPAGHCHHRPVRRRCGQRGGGAHQAGAAAQVPQCGRRGGSEPPLRLRRGH